MKHRALGKNTFSKFTEILIYIGFILSAYNYAKVATVNFNGLSIILLGFILFLIAKISVIKKGHYFTFGCDNMSTKMMISYFLGYVLMILGYLVTFSVV